jgi:hypothetical protein
MNKEDTSWYAINDLELNRFYMAALMACDIEAAFTFEKIIRNRVIDYHEKEEE